MDKSLKIIWWINGIIFLLGSIIIGIALLWNFIGDFGYDRTLNPDEIRKADKSGLLKHSLSYPNLYAVTGNQTYLLPIERESEQVVSSSAGFVASRYGISIENKVLNLIFLKKDFTYSHTLLEKNGYIESLKYPSDKKESDYSYSEEVLAPSIQVITFIMASADTNNDSFIDEDDQSNLFITDIEGKNLRQITTGMTLIDYSFVDDTTLLIEYYKQEDNAMTDNPIKYFAIYDLKNDSLRHLSDLHEAIQKIETSVAK